MPVCGVDGKTYPNPSSLKCAKVKLKHKGACKNKNPCFITKDIRQVCGVDGKTYINISFLKCAKVKLRNKGPCKDDCNCNKFPR